MLAGDTDHLLGADDTLRLAEFARACRAATRIVALYPATHPHITRALARIGDAAARLRRHADISLAVFPDDLRLDGARCERADSAATELAGLLHGHLVGELRLSNDLTDAEWHAFLCLLARAPDELRGAGGIAEAWSAHGCNALELHLIDYAEVLRERQGVAGASWDRIVSDFLDGVHGGIGAGALNTLLEISDDAEKFGSFAEHLATRGGGSGSGSGGHSGGWTGSGSGSGEHASMQRVMRTLVDRVAVERPDKLETVLERIAGVVPHMSADAVASLVHRAGDTASAESGETAGGGGGVDGGGTMGVGVDLGSEIRTRLSDQSIAGFVAQNVARDEGASGRLAQAFQALIPDHDKRVPLLNLAEVQALRLPIGQHPNFAQLWKRASDMLTSYSDQDWVTDDYSEEMARASDGAVDVDKVTDDPPERVAAWKQTVTEDGVRALEHRVLLDLITIETRPEAWPRVLESIVAAITDRVRAERLEYAQELLDHLVVAAEDAAPFAPLARQGLERLRSNEAMRSVVVFIRQGPLDQREEIARFCRTLGPEVIAPLADALASSHGAAVTRLRDVILSFGAAGKDYATNLLSSSNPEARRTAIDILRACGGMDALPDLAVLLSDSDVSVQREALRALVQMGTAEAFAVLRQALAKESTRDAIMKALVTTRDEQMAPLFVYLLDQLDHHGNFEAVYTSTIQALGKIRGDRRTVQALSQVLHRGEWWAPRRTRRLRAAAAMALRTCGSPEGRTALQQAASEGARGVRKAAQSVLDSMRSPVALRGAA